MLGAVLLLTSPDFFIFKQYIMSDPAFLFFITASILLPGCIMKKRKETAGPETGLPL